MAATTAKKGVGLYLDAVAIVLAVAGIVAMIVSGTMGSGYEFSGLPLYACACVLAVALIVVAIYTDLKCAEKGPGLVALFALGVAIFLLAYSGIQVVSSRALTISGLFSWNSMDTTGWHMFWAAATSAGCLLASSVLLTIGGFLPIAKAPAR
ncbi:MAG: hypothetical protein MR874_07965 [Coriobacteriaceae bacterium]|uniref:hypothetical protein n=1 Tax=Tractidigestivibacter sp. TaxID=2847320 RepID=UPI002A82D097|nr:hypothetical protein [Tractidigestivibacter sp.]MCI6274373.1 hypothetical protein [Coriobacteriaceae bacterium]MCI6548811.1 hypothetical protein [Coriobacteriaceae bacterium]MCI6844675.1 hypothetical protein [Coriobacteriaceae bacterium]MCI7437978.1 hypothetical protein [Coriobacteriaceae bacterium]MDD7585011.1 hypothetical protein [Coriobacteriaceae bacterium]